MTDNTKLAAGLAAIAGGLLIAQRALATPEVKPDTKGGPEAPADPRAPRGIRNNNPGNIIYTGIPWRGLLGVDDTGYIIFDSPVNGIRAMVRDLRTGFERDKEDTITEIITEWAPPTENNTEAYIQSVSSQMGRGPNEKLVFDRDIKDLVNAIIFHENGQNPYLPSLIEAGIEQERT